MKQNHIVKFDDKIETISFIGSNRPLCYKSFRIKTFCYIY